MTGVVGLTLYLTMLVLVLGCCRRVWRGATMTREHRALATGVGAATVAVCVHSVFVNSLLTPFVMEPLWVLWALVSILARTIVLPAPRRERVRLVAVTARP
jgi:O-antigen ligase